MADRTTKVRLTAEVQSYIDGMQKAAQATRETGSATEKLAQQQQAFEDMGRAAMVAGGTIAAGLGLSVKAAMDWESAWAGVTKTVEGSDSELAAIEQGLRDLTSVLPASHTEIAAVAEAAGQLGIQTPNVVEFTRTMIDLGETTNLSADQAATSLAQMMNIMGTSQSEVDRMGATLVALGNAGASTESEILMMAQRIAGAGKLVGATEGEVLGLSNALASMGVTAELGGGVASRILQDLYNAVQEGGESLDGFAKVAGVSSQEFAQAFENDPVRALDTFSKGLNGVEASGGNVVKTLTDLGFKSTEEQRVLLQLKGAGDLLTDSLDLQAKAWEANSALTDEAAKRYETTEAKLGMMRNKVVDAAISIGEQLLPAVEGIAEGIGNFADMIGGFEGPGAAFAAWAGVAASGVLLLGGAALASIPKIAAYKVAMETLGISTGGFARGARGAAAFLGGPWGVALGAATITLAAFNAEIEKGVPTQAEISAALKDSSSAAEQLRAASQRGGMEQFFWGDYQDSLGNLPELLTKAKVAEDNWAVGLAMNGPNYKGAIDSLERLGDSYGELAATDLPRAQDSFRQMRDEYKLTDEQAATLLDQMPGFKDALLSAADAAGVAADDSSILQFALGNVGDAAVEGAAGTEEQTVSLEELSGVAESTSEAVAELADQIREFGAAQFDVESSAIGFNQAFADLQTNLDSGAGSLDLATQAGRDTGNALLEAASSTNEYAAAIFAAGGSTEEVGAILDSGRQKIIDTRLALGDTAEQAQAYADKLIATPEAIATHVQLNGADTAESILNTVTRTRETYINVITNGVQAAADALANAFGSANGNLFAYANGGIEAYANGGFPTGIYKGGAPIHKFAEPETGWEAYISGKPDQRDRNRQIWQETGARLGMSTAAAPVSLVAYVENPWGDGYLQAKVRQVANEEIDGYSNQRAKAQRRTGMTG